MELRRHSKGLMEVQEGNMSSREVLVRQQQIGNVLFSVIEIEICVMISYRFL